MYKHAQKVQTGKFSNSYIHELSQYSYKLCLIIKLFVNQMQALEGTLIVLSFFLNVFT